MKTMTIKILVAVGSNGDWAASGWGQKDKTPDKVSIETMKGIASDNLEADQYHHYVWVDAEVPIPEISTIFGTAIKTELPG